MRRKVSFEEISDGRRLSAQDMARLDAHGCEGCSYCCREMTDTIVLDPWDMYMLPAGSGKTEKTGFSGLLAKGLISIDVFDGLTLPRLGMKADRSCVFLDGGRCGIHSFRPGFCRLFPLGRIYEEDSFSYFVQKDECVKTDRSKVKIEKWLGIPALKTYEKYILDWHSLTESLRAYLNGRDDVTAKKVNTMLLKIFYLDDYDTDRDFYVQYYERKEQLMR